jgi:hypothetical protein
MRAMDVLCGLFPFETVSVVVSDLVPCVLHPCKQREIRMQTAGVSGVRTHVKGHETPQK